MWLLVRIASIRPGFRISNSVVPGQVKDLVRTQDYLKIFKTQTEDEKSARSWAALVRLLHARDSIPETSAPEPPCFVVARELGALKTEEELLRQGRRVA